MGVVFMLKYYMNINGVVFMLKYYMNINNGCGFHAEYFSMKTIPINIHIILQHENHTH
jgi:hypothetical protein